MKLYVWHEVLCGGISEGFGFALAETVEQARDLLAAAFETNSFTDRSATYRAGAKELKAYLSRQTQPSFVREAFEKKPEIYDLDGPIAYMIFGAE